MSFHFASLLPLWLTLLLAGALLAAILFGVGTMMRKHVPPRLVGIIAALRLAVFVIFVLVLFQPALSFSSELKQLPEMAVLGDVSKSMGHPSETAGAKRLEEKTHGVAKGEGRRTL